jgi:integrase/recombinase XerD
VVVFLLLKWALNEFQQDREYRNISPRTIIYYMSSLKEFHEYSVLQYIVNLEDCSASLVKNYLLYCGKERKNNPTTVNSKLHVLKIFFNYFESEMEVFTVKTNPTKRIQFAREEIKIEVFTDSHIKQMLNYYQKLKHRDKSLYSYRDWFMIIFLIGSACRLGETINMKWSDVDLNNLVVTLTGKKRV